MGAWTEAREALRRLELSAYHKVYPNLQRPTFTYRVRAAMRKQAEKQVWSKQVLAKILEETGTD